MQLRLHAALSSILKLHCVNETCVRVLPVYLE